MRASRPGDDFGAIAPSITIGRLAGWPTVLLVAGADRIGDLLKARDAQPAPQLLMLQDSGASK